jgi:hypothetical protein
VLEACREGKYTFGSKLSAKVVKDTELAIFQTRVYEKLRFSRVRQSQLNGEDIRDRWHNALKNLDEDVEIDPEDVKMRVSLVQT